MRYLVTGKQAAEIDRHTIQGIGVPQLVLMERASLAVAEETAKLLKDDRKDRILVVVESGNNGGDGVAVARILHQRGYRVEVHPLNGISRQSEAYRKQVELAEKAGVPFTERLQPEDYRVIVDAIFGVGLTREVVGVQKEAVHRIVEARAASPEMKVIAVDIPTGISSETGEVLGEAVRADLTVTFGFEKVGMRFAKAYCGTVSVHEIGFFLPERSEEILEYMTYEERDIPTLLPQRFADGNKGSFGRVLVIAGSRDMSGAAYLAAEAAYRTGSGLVMVLTHESNREALQQLLPEALLRTYTDESRPEEFLPDALRWASVIILGPGIGQSGMAERITETVLKEAACPVILDADGINVTAEHTEWLSETAGKRPLILTPHMLEMTRLSEKTLHPERTALEKLKKDRPEIVKKTADMYGATVVLKDACTVVTEGRECFLNSSGNDAMAKGGSGDVLTGVIAAFTAQGLSPEMAARLGVYVHGLAGDRARDELGPYGVLAGDLIRHVAGVLKASV